MRSYMWYLQVVYFMLSWRSPLSIQSGILLGLGGLGVVYRVWLFLWMVRVRNVSLLAAGFMCAVWHLLHLQLYSFTRLTGHVYRADRDCVLVAEYLYQSKPKFIDPLWPWGKFQMVKQLLYRSAVPFAPVAFKLKVCRLSQSSALFGSSGFGGSKCKYGSKNWTRKHAGHLSQLATCIRRF